MLKLILICLLAALSITSWSQIEQSEDANFLVEFDKFEPSTQDLIKSFEGAPPMQFMAPDLEGEEHFLGNYKGQTVFVYFFNQSCELCTSQISSLNLLNEELAGDLKIIAIGDESKEELKDFRDQQGIQYDVLYNGKLLGEVAYGIEMGYPRLFVIDDTGITRHVLPLEAFKDPKHTYIILKNLYDLVNAK